MIPLKSLRNLETLPIISNLILNGMEFMMASMNVFSTLTSKGHSLLKKQLLLHNQI